MIRVSDNFKYEGPKPNFERDFYQTVDAMKVVIDDYIDDGHLSYCAETKKIYEYLYSNPIDPETGKWRIYKPVDSKLDASSENAIQTKAVKETVENIIKDFSDLGDTIDNLEFDSRLDEKSENTVQNKIITAQFDTIGKQLVNYANAAKDFLKKTEVLGEINATSTLPVQNKVLGAEFKNISEQISNLTERINRVIPVDLVLSKASIRPVANSAVTPMVKKLQGNIEDLYHKVEGIKYIGAQTYYVSGWSDDDKLTPTSIPGESYGNPDVLRRWEFYLVDHSKVNSDGTTLAPLAHLKRNNLFRDVDGNFVKTVFTNLQCKFTFESALSGTQSIFGDWFIEEQLKKANNNGGAGYWIGLIGRGGGFNNREIWSSIVGDGNGGIRLDVGKDGEIVFIEDSRTFGTTEDKVLSLEEFSTKYLTLGASGYIESISNDKKGGSWYIVNGGNQGSSFVYKLSNPPYPWEEYQQAGKGFSSLQSVVLGNPKTLYLLDQVKGKSGKIWKGVFEEPVIWDGIDISKYELKPTGMGPTPATSVFDGTVQKMFTRYVDFYKLSSKTNDGSDGLRPGTNCMGSTSMYVPGTTCFKSETHEVGGETYKRYIYGRSSDVSQLTNCTYARNNNPDVKNPYPFAEGGYHSRNTFVSAMETLHKTKYLNKSDFFASGISANDAVTNETQLMTYGGIRWKVKGSDTWSYGTWNTTPSNLAYNSSGARTHFNALLAYWYPKEQCLESQIAASFAVECDMKEGDHFNLYGGEYWYKNVPGTVALKDGDMNCIVYKKIPYTMEAYNASGEPTTFELEIVLRMSLMNGYNHSGDYWIYYGGGYEQVGTVAPVYNTAGSMLSTGHPVSIYSCFDQTKWRSTSELQTVTMNNLGEFVFESDPNYLKVWEGVNLGDGYCLVRPSYTAYKSEAGGSLGTGECFYAYTSKNWSSTLGQRVRIGEMTRYTHEGNTAFISSQRCGIRSKWYYGYGCSIVRESIGGSLQCLLGV